MMSGLVNVFQKSDFPYGFIEQKALTFSIEQLPIFVKICEKETVDQGGLSQARLSFKQRKEKGTDLRLGD